MFFGWILQMQATKHPGSHCSAKNAKTLAVSVVAATINFKPKNIMRQKDNQISTTNFKKAIIG